MLRAVIDTNVVFEGLTHLGPSAGVVDAWVTRRFRPCVSTALAFEYQDVLGRKLGPSRGEQILKALQALLSYCEYVPISFTYRPASPDPGDDMVVDCALNANALVVTRNVKDFRGPSVDLGLDVLLPEDFLGVLKRKGELS